jgi:hypothetical protein
MAEIKAQHRFWYASTKVDKETQEVKVTGVQIDLLIFIEYLYSLGIRADKIQNNIIYYRLLNDTKILEMLEHEELAAIFLREVSKLPDEVPAFNRYGEKLESVFPSSWIREKILKSIGYYFDKKKLSATLYNKQNLQMNEDTARAKFVYFKNGFLEITSKAINFNKYSKLKGYVWSTEIIQHVYKHDKDFNFVCVAQKFVYNVSGNDENRYADLIKIIGYAAHNYTGGKLKAILFTDSALDESGEPNGRSGKTLLTRLIGGLYTTNPLKRSSAEFVEINGKNFDPTNQFRYQSCSHNTRLIVLNDTKKFLNLEYLFNDITDGAQVEKKSMTPFYINAKMIINTNLTIDLSGSSKKDRVCMFEFSDYYNEKRSPADEFGGFFFTDWSAQELDSYYHYMAFCVQSWLQGPTLPQVAQINYAARHLAEHTNEQFIEWSDKNIITGQLYGKTEMLEKIQKEITTLHKMSSKKFAMWIKTYNNAQPQKFAPWNADQNESRENGSERMFKLIAANYNPLE